MKQRFRWLFALLAVCMVIAMLPVQALAAEKTFTDEYGTWTYEEDADGNIVIISFKSAKKNVVVPVSIDGKPVKKLGDGLFKDRSDLTMIVIPNGITEIGKDVFSGCEKLEKVDLPQSLTTIGDGAFSNCEKLEQVFIPSSVTELGEGLFVGSPVVEVRCDVDSAAAEYLKENAEDVNSFVLIEVVTPQPVVPETPAAPSNPGTPIAPETPEPPEEPVQGALVTYNFGQNIEGQREFTVILLDTLPDMDLSKYITVREDGSLDLAPGAVELLSERFQLVSVSRFDGKTAQDVTPSDTRLGLYIQSNPQNDGSFAISYELRLAGDKEDKTVLCSMNFNSNSEIMDYTLGKIVDDYSVVKLGEQVYVEYGVRTNKYSELHYADGALVNDGIYKESYAHKIAIGGQCVMVDLFEGDGFSNKTVEAYDKEGGVAGVVNLWSGENAKGVNSVKKVSGTVVSDENKVMSFDEQGELTQSLINRNTPNGDGTYTFYDSTYGKEGGWSYKNTYQTDQGEQIIEDHAWTNHDYVEYRDYVVRADDAADARDTVNAPQFPNEPSEKVDFVTEKTYEYTGEQVHDYTIKNEATGDTQSFTDVATNLRMEYHTYIGDTGKFEGWDWYFENGTSTNGQDDQVYTFTNYQVNEYRYDKENKTWTKTAVYVSTSTDAAKDPETFKQQYIKGDLGDCQIYTDKFVFDPTTDSGADNWKWVEPEEGEGWTEEGNAILAGETEISDADGNAITQGDAMDELLEAGKNAEESLKTDDLEQIFDDAVKDLGASDVVEEAEKNFENETVPETNTDEWVEHKHNEDGTIDTEVHKPELPAAEEPAPETEAETITEA